MCTQFDWSISMMTQFHWPISMMSLMMWLSIFQNSLKPFRSEVIFKFKSHQSNLVKPDEGGVICPYSISFACHVISPAVRSLFYPAMRQLTSKWGISIAKVVHDMIDIGKCLTRWNRFCDHPLIMLITCLVILLYF